MLPLSAGCSKKLPDAGKIGDLPEMSGGCWKKLPAAGKVGRIG
jgi:hypothetical protein